MNAVCCDDRQNQDRRTGIGRCARSPLQLDPWGTQGSHPPPRQQAGVRFQGLSGAGARLRPSAGIHLALYPLAEQPLRAIHPFIQRAMRLAPLRPGPPGRPGRRGPLHQPLQHQEAPPGPRLPNTPTGVPQPPTHSLICLRLVQQPGRCYTGRPGSKFSARSPVIHRPAITKEA